MSEQPIKLNIDLSKIDKTAFYEGKKSKYLNLVIWPNRDGEDQYGNTHSVQQELPRERRDKGDKNPYVGNGKTFGNASGAGFKATGKPGSERPKNGAPASQDDDDDDGLIPF